MKKKIKDLTYEEFTKNWTKIDEVVVTMVAMYCGTQKEVFNKVFPQIMETCPLCVQNQEIEVKEYDTH